MLLNHSRPSSKQVNRNVSNFSSSVFQIRFTNWSVYMLRLFDVNCTLYKSVKVTSGPSVFLIRTNKNKIVLLCFTLNFSHVTFCFSPETTFLFAVTSRVTQLFTRQTAIFRQKNISPQFFFDILSNGCIVNP